MRFWWKDFSCPCILPDIQTCFDIDVLLALLIVFNLRLLLSAILDFVGAVHVHRFFTKELNYRFKQSPFFNSFTIFWRPVHFMRDSLRFSV